MVELEQPPHKHLDDLVIFWHNAFKESQKCDKKENPGVSIIKLPSYLSNAIVTFDGFRIFFEIFCLLHQATVLCVLSRRLNYALVTRDKPHGELRKNPPEGGHTRDPDAWINQEKRGFTVDTRGYTRIHADTRG